MLFQLFGLAIVVVATFFVYKTAKENGRRPLSWALANFGVGIGFQIILPFVLATAVAIFLLLSGESQDKLQDAMMGPGWIIIFVGLSSSIVGMGLILRFVAKIPEGATVIPAKRDLSIFNADE
jgi:hypothetical protein